MDAIEAALRELVRLKDLKEGIEDDEEASVALLEQRLGPGWFVNLHRRRAEYDELKPLAWKVAREALNVSGRCAHEFRPHRMVTNDEGDKIVMKTEKCVKCDIEREEGAGRYR